MSEIINTNELKTINKKEFGRLFSNSSDYTQAGFINAIGYAFKTSSFSGRRDGQYVHIVDELDKNGMDFISELAEFVNLRKEHE